MAVRHLTDKEMQDYLDGNLSQEHFSFVTRHLQVCKKCRHEMNRYEILYSGLKQDVGINLSPDFSKSVMLKLQKERAGLLYSRFRDIFLAIVGLIIGVGTTIYFVDFRSLIKTYADIPKPQINFNAEIFSNIKGFLTGLNLNLGLIMFAGLILLLFFAIDHIISRHKKKLISYFRMLPTLCQL